MMLIDRKARMPSILLPRAVPFMADLMRASEASRAAVITRVAAEAQRAL